MKQSLDRPAVYQIKVQGRLDAGWSAWFEGLAVTFETGDGCSTITTLTGVVADQSALYGLLSRVRDLGLPLLLVQCLDNQC